MVQKLHCNPIPTFFLVRTCKTFSFRLCNEIIGNNISTVRKKRCRNKITCVVLHLASIVPALPAYVHVHTSNLCCFWHYHPFIPLRFGKCFYTCYERSAQGTTQLWDVLLVLRYMTQKSYPNVTNCLELSNTNISRILS